MMKQLRHALCLFLILSLACVTQAAQGPSAKSAPRKPVPPLKIAAPKAPSSTYEGRDLKVIEGRVLKGGARSAARENDYPVAFQLQYWAVQKLGTGQYDLACYATMNGDVDGGFYWLQEAAFKDGVDFGWASQDSDLEKVRADPRWKTITPYLQASNAYWAESGIVATVVVLPKNYKNGTPIGVVVGMHGMGSKPSDFVDAERYQEFADTLNMAIVAISGTMPRGPDKFVWAEDGEKDHQHIQKVLNDLSKQFTVKPGRIVLYGFSQGGQMAFEAAWLHPETSRGALVMSPGTSTHPRTVGQSSAPGNKNQGYIFLCGADEHPGNVALAKQGANRAKKGQAASELKLYEGVAAHAFPADFGDEFVRWVRQIDGANGGK